MKQRERSGGDPGSKVNLPRPGYSTGPTQFANTRRARAWEAHLSVSVAVQKELENYADVNCNIDAHTGNMLSSMIFFLCW